MIKIKYNKMENNDIGTGIDMVGEPLIPYGISRRNSDASGTPIRKITRTQLEEETITVEELDRRLTSFIDKHFEVV